jgi:hypothetical protein
MKENAIEKGRFSQDGHGLGTVTEEMVRERARELAVINGRTEKQVLSTDLEEARRELTGEESLNPTTTAAEELPEEDRWHPGPESAGRQVEAEGAPDEQTFAEKLVEEGVEDAEQNQMLEATREGLKRDKES